MPDTLANPSPLAFLIALATLAGPVVAQEPGGSVEAGHDLARRWCSDCHQVEADALQASDAAPGFAGIAPDLPTDNNGPLRAWLIAPHEPMLRLDLDEEQIADLIAYIRSLAP